MWLNDADFRVVVGATPLVSIDLIVENEAGQVLLGQRLHRPAKGFWFVPGGRVRKNERLDDAFLRLTETELGRAAPRRSAQWLGVYEHLYPDSVFGEGGEAPDTHYVVLAYRLRLDADEVHTLPAGQHSRWQWWSPAEALQSADVHPMTQAYLLA